jgi:hypothetical protein
MVLLTNNNPRLETLTLLDFSGRAASIGSLKTGDQE